MSTQDIILSAYASNVTPGATGVEWDIKLYKSSSSPSVSSLAYVILSNSSLAGVTSVLINGIAATIISTPIIVTPYQQTIPSLTNVLSFVPGSSTSFNVDGPNDIVVTGVTNSTSTLDLVEILTVDITLSPPTVFGFSGTVIYLVKPNLPPPLPLPLPYDPLEKILHTLKDMEKQLRCLEKKVCKLSC